MQPANPPPKIPFSEGMCKLFIYFYVSMYMYVYMY